MKPIGLLTAPLLLMAAAAIVVYRLATPPSPPPRPARIDFVLVEKGKRELRLIARGVVVRVYRVSLGRNPMGPKVREGDGRTPEGRYLIDYRNPRSSFHLALHISYPNDADRRLAARLGVSPGGAVMIHGPPNGIAFIGRRRNPGDWTEGCIAVNEREIEEIFRAVPVGTPIEIRA